MIRLGICDADTVIYKEALRGQGDTFDFDPDFPIHISETDYENMYSDIQDRFRELMFESNCTEMRCYLTGQGNFRYNFLPSYKWRRDPRQTPIALARLKEMCLERMDNCFMIEGEEADDSCTRDFSTPEEVAHLCLDCQTEFSICLDECPDCLSDFREGIDYEKVLLHVDKDLNQVVGEHFNYTHIEEDYGTYHITQEEADAWAWYQTLAGDTADCYKGCPMVGGEIDKKSKAGKEMTKKERIFNSKAMKIVMGTLCVRPYYHRPTKGKDAGKTFLKWEEYHDASLTLAQRVLTWFIKGYTAKGANYWGMGYEYNPEKFDTTSGYEQIRFEPFEVRGEPAISEDALEYIKKEIQTQYTVAYMLRCGESIPSKLHEIKF